MRVWLAGLSIVLAGACTSASGRPPVLLGEPASESASTVCPLGFNRARLEWDETTDGVDLTINAYGDIHELRQRAHDAAAMYGPGGHRGLGHRGEHGKGGHHGLGLSRLGVAVRATAENTDEGARIHIVPVDPADLERMRVALRERADEAREGACP